MENIKSLEQQVSDLEDMYLKDTTELKAQLDAMREERDLWKQRFEEKTTKPVRHV